MKNSSYFDQMTQTMTAISQDPKLIFVGQAVEYAGTAMKSTLTGVPDSQLMEVPVEEDFQMGLCIGLSLKGYQPISIFPRWNFLLLATNQIVNHLDKLKHLTLSQPPKVVIRVGVGSESPLHPGPQHVGDFTESFKLLCPNMNIVQLRNSSDISSEYLHALSRNDGVSTILVEYSDLFN
jgi:pyruvate/2-oxoglutarate/acetoin dehydrogenase E1 component